MSIFTPTLVCLKKDNTTVIVGMKQFPPNCPKINYNNQCSANFSAWLPAVTVCRQALFS
jgi:hypothetical protein